MNQIRRSVVFSFQTSFQASRSSVLPFCRIEVKSPLELIHTQQWLILKSHSLLWHVFDSCTIPTLVSTLIRYWKQQFNPAESQLGKKRDKSSGNDNFSSPHWLKSSGLHVVWSNASLSKDAIKSSSVFRANGVYDLCLLNGKAPQHEMTGLCAKLGINT